MDSFFSKKRAWIIGSHRGCRDGFVSQLIARKYYKENPPSDDVEIVYWLFDQDKKDDDLEKLWKMCKYRFSGIHKIYMFDVDFGPKHLICMLKECETSDVKIFDHHITSKREFDSNEDAKLQDHFIFDIEECGATLAWKFYYPKVAPPKFLGYVKDRDLWLADKPEKSQPNSKEVNEYLYATTPHFKETEKWFWYLELRGGEETKFYDNAAELGKLLLLVKQRNIDAIVKGGRVHNLDGHRVYVMNSSTHRSEAGSHAVNLTEADESATGRYICDYAIIWRLSEDRDGPPEYHISFRSRGDVDVSVIAKKFGGGGHEAASGCTLNDISVLLPYLPPKV